MADDQVADSQAAPVPLVVDLDGTLIKSDLLVESLFTLLYQSPTTVFTLPFWLLKGKAAFKRQIADRVDLNVEQLPYNQELLDYLRDQRTDGRALILATASDSQLAERVAEHVGLFDRVLASDGSTNLSALDKRNRLVDTFGNARFDYVGNASADLHVWPCAREAILVDVSPNLRRKAEQLANVKRIFSSGAPTTMAYLRALRPHQWLKNLLVFAPFIAAHELDHMQMWVNATLAFVAFSLCASGVYLFNDLIDLPADRAHPKKRYRPFAAGEISVVTGFYGIPILLISALALGALISPFLLAVLVLYCAISICYSLLLKRILMLDVLVLAGLYSLRILAGSAAIEIPPSAWFLAFAMFLFLSLAIVKRYTELLGMQARGRAKVQHRSYYVDDLNMLSILGATSGYLSVLVLALYINSSRALHMYALPELIWLLCPLQMYWVGRLWILASRGKVDEDPVIFALTDRSSRWVAVAAFVVVLLAN